MAPSFADESIARLVQETSGVDRSKLSFVNVEPGLRSVLRFAVASRNRMIPTPPEAVS